MTPDFVNPAGFLLAPSTIPARAEFLQGWAGPVVFENTYAVLLGPDEEYPGRWLISCVAGWVIMNDHTWCRSVELSELSLDPRRLEVQDHLVRVLNLPSWLCCGPGRRMESWQSAGLIACAVAGIIPLTLYLTLHPNLKPTDDPDIQWDCANMISENEMALPWPGAPRLWTRE